MTGVQGFTHVAFIRGIGPETHKKMPMSELSVSGRKAGLENCTTVLATGNVLFTSQLNEEQLEELFASLLLSFSLSNEVFFRTRQEVQSLVRNNPHAKAADDHPSRFVVMLFRSPPALEKLDLLLTTPGREPAVLAGRQLYIDYEQGISNSRMTPALIEKKLGQKGTFRNWNSLSRVLARMTEA